MTYLKPSLILCFLMISSIACRNLQTSQYNEEIDSWRAARIERLKSKTGWLNLAGLFWLKEGVNTLGSDSTNTIIFPPSAPAFIGNIQLSGDSLFFTVNPGTKINVDNEPVIRKTLNSDAMGKASLMESGNLGWYIIKRDGQYGIRLRDYQHPRIEQLKSIPSYETSLDWRIVADFVPFDSIRKIETITITGGTEINNCPGELVFRKGMKKYRLLPFSEGNDFFIIFADKTNGIETYGNGRFMYCPLPDSSGKVILDFNKAYNPPCAFSPFATCPMPPRENILDLEIRSGEKEVHLL